jgi:hypothetical protein
MKRTTDPTARPVAGLALAELTAGCSDAGKAVHAPSAVKVSAAQGSREGRQKHKGADAVNSSPNRSRRTTPGVWRWVSGALLALACIAPAWSQGKKPDLYDLDANLVLLSPKVKPIYLKALGPLAHEQWLARLDGPAPQNKRVTVAGSDFVHMSSCKNHDCADNNAVFLYSPEQGVLYGTVYQKGKTTLIGAPPPAVASELPALWKKQFRQQP